jgi:hypothetical protein
VPTVPVLSPVLLGWAVSFAGQQSVGSLGALCPRAFLESVCLSWDPIMLGEPWALHEWCLLFFRIHNSKPNL